MKIDAVLFDLDGTLLDTSTLIISSFQHTFLQHYNRQLTFEELQPYWGRTLRLAMEELGRPGEADSLITTYRQHNLTHHDAMVEIFPEVADVLAELCGRGISLGVVTSKTQATALRGLQLFGLDQYINSIVGVEQCRHHKPHPEPVLNGVAALAKEPGCCIYVGDAPSDLQSGKLAGTYTAAVAWTKLPLERLTVEHPDVILTSMREILQLV